MCCVSSLFNASFFGRFRGFHIRAGQPMWTITYDDSDVVEELSQQDVDEAMQLYRKLMLSAFKNVYLTKPVVGENDKGTDDDSMSSVGGVSPTASFEENDA